MEKDHIFTSTRLTFRGINETDTKLLVKWRSDETVIRYFRNPVPVTEAGHTKWYRESYSSNPNRYDFIIFEKKFGQAIGTVGVNDLNRESESCEISYMIAESAFQRKGYAVEAIGAMMDFMLTEDIRHFFAEIHSDNLASIRTIKKLGYEAYTQRPPFLIYHKVY